MSWAAKRRTTRVEDLPYCLFGIFDVHLPLIYGEVMKAFLRLQEAIALENNDLSLFAWKSNPDEDYGLRGILALHPSEFQSCSDLRRVAASTDPTPVFSFTNKGFHITTRLLQGNGEYLVDLECVSGSGFRAIRLLKTIDGFIRHESSKLDSPGQFKVTQEVSVYIPRTITPAQSKELKFQRSHTFAPSFENRSGLSLDCHFSGRPDHLWDESISSFLTGGPNEFRAILEITIRGTVDFSGAGLSPAQLLWKGSALLGLEFNLNAPKYLLVPWAAIYDRNDNYMNNIIRLEKRHGTPRALGFIYWSRESSEFPEDLEFHLEWEFVSKGAERDQWNKWISENQFRLHASTKVTGECGEKRLLILELQRESKTQMEITFPGEM
jgi:hypothetical protein